MYFSSVSRTKKTDSRETRVFPLGKAGFLHASQLFVLHTAFSVSTNRNS
ncbi:Uncharacterized protein dnm_051970 [Desulfonema magnum]|uniref:Uncharacterized protein n=1 Tax=Desulfonema magnum TaxID=45655 RepID=A0A975BPU4_9BACT|nr:Uncharacterized protein dnm_051970 [Desulfonema magnum]